MFFVSFFQASNEQGNRRVRDARQVEAMNRRGRPTAALGGSDDGRPPLLTPLSPLVGRFFMVGNSNRFLKCEWIAKCIEVQCGKLSAR
jgi:hypothetical protein